MAPAGAPDLPKIQFPMPPAVLGNFRPAARFPHLVDVVRKFHFLDEQSTRTSQCPPNEYKNHLLLSLLGAEGTACFACNPMASQLDTATFNAFSAEVKKYFQPCIKTLRAHYNFMTRKQHEGEKVADYLCALHAVLVDCHITSLDEQRHALPNQLVVGCRNRETLQKLFVIRETDFDPNQWNHGGRRKGLR